MAVLFSWSSVVRIILLIILFIAFAAAFISIPVEKTLKNFLQWVEKDLGPWGPLALALAYVPLTILAVPASVLTLGGGYLFGLTVGFIADSVGSTIGATAAFLLGRTIGRTYIISILNDYPKFNSVAIAIQRSGFKIVLLLRLVPLLPFNMVNYLLSVTPVPLGEYVVASWVGMMPLTLALVYVGTTLKDLSDVTHGWGDTSSTHWIYVIAGIVISIALMVYITHVAKVSLENALEENEEEREGLASGSQRPPIAAETGLDLEKSLMKSQERSIRR